MTDLGYFIFLGIPAIMVTGFLFYVMLTIITILVNCIASINK